MKEPRFSVLIGSEVRGLVNRWGLIQPFQPERTGSPPSGLNSHSYFLRVGHSTPSKGKLRERNLTWVQSLEKIFLPFDIVALVFLHPELIEAGLLSSPRFICKQSAGPITLGIYNSGDKPIPLPPNSGFAEIIFLRSGRDRMRRAPSLTPPPWTPCREGGE